jgi:hypothetical protein
MKAEVIAEFIVRAMNERSNPAQSGCTCDVVRLRNDLTKVIQNLIAEGWYPGEMSAELLANGEPGEVKSLFNQFPSFLLVEPILKEIFDGEPRTDDIWVE